MSRRLFLAFGISFLFQSCVFATFPGLGSGLRQDFEEKVISGRDEDKILMIPIEGVISDETKETFFGGSVESLVSRVKEALKYAERDNNVKGILLKINSPGGTVTASDILYEEILKFKRKKNIPVVAGFMDTAASGAYYISMASDSIGAHPTTVTGSIGVVLGGVNVKEGLDKIGVKDQSITSGNNKTIGSPLTEMGPEQRKILQSIVDGLFDRFFTIVKRGRPNASEARLKTICDGRIFTAEQAKNEGLIDFIGYFDDFILQVMNHPKYSGNRSGNPRLVVLQRGRGKVDNVYQASIDPNKAFTLGNLHPILEPMPSSKFLYLWNP